MTKRAQQNEGFAALGLDTRIVEALTTLGYEEPTPIQQQTIPPLLDGRDLLGQAATGHRQDGGVRAADAAALIDAGGASSAGPLAWSWCRRASWRCRSPRRCTATARRSACACCPSTAGSRSGARSTRCARGVDVVVATPGRALDHLRRGTLQLGGVRIVVLDEADEMLDMGFAEDIEAILRNRRPGGRRCSSRPPCPPRIEAIAKRHQRDPVRIRSRARGEGGRSAQGPPARVRGAARAQDGGARPRSSISSRRPRRSSSAARASRSTSSPRR